MSSARTAQCSGVVPSASGALMSAPRQDSASKENAARMRMWGLLNGLDHAGAITQALDLDPGLVQHGQQHVGHGSVIGLADMLAALHRPGAAAQNQRRQREMVMRVAVAHVAAVQNERMIEQGPIPVLDAVEFFEEFREQRQMIRLDLHQLLDLVCAVLMMRGGV